MTYKRPRRVMHLVFAADSDYAGLEVRVQALTMGEYYDWYTSSDQQDTFAEKLVSWNVVDDDDRPVPATRAGIDTREPDEIIAIKRAWIDALIRVRENDPLALSSTSGLPAAVLDLPAEPLGEHLAST